MRALREAGYDALAFSEVMSRSDDRTLIEQTGREQRILLTDDKDFGWLVFASHTVSPGIVLIRYPGNVRQKLSRAVLQVVREQGGRLTGAFVVVQPGTIRISHSRAPL